MLRGQSSSKFKTSFMIHILSPIVSLCSHHSSFVWLDKIALMLFIPHSLLCPEHPLSSRWSSLALSFLIPAFLTAQVHLLGGWQSPLSSMGGEARKKSGKSYFFQSALNVNLVFLNTCWAIVFLLCKEDNLHVFPPVSLIQSLLWAEFIILARINS